MIGVDSDASQARDVSRRAARPERKGGSPNALFLVAAAETLPGLLRGVADVVTVMLPWGSLLRKLVAAEPALVTSIARLLKPDGALELMLSVGPGDAAAGMAALDDRAVHALALSYAGMGLVPIEVRRATAADVDGAGSTWGKRLGIPARRDAWLLRFNRVPPYAAEPSAGAEPIAGSAASDVHIVATPSRN